MLAALQLLGGHWFAMQGIAWVTMIVDQSQETSLVEAVTKTFDGQHPCALCEVVASGQEKERDQQSTLVDPSTKLAAVLPVTVSPSPLCSSTLTYFPVATCMASVDGALLSPPPRAI